MPLFNFRLLLLSLRRHWEIRKISADCWTFPFSGIFCCERFGDQIKKCSDIIISKLNQNTVKNPFVNLTISILNWINLNFGITQRFYKTIIIIETWIEIFYMKMFVKRIAICFQKTDRLSKQKAGFDIEKKVTLTFICEVEINVWFIF